MFSMSMTLSEDLLQRFNRSCCVIVGGIPYWRKFATQVAREIDRKKFRAVYPDGTKSESAHMPVTNVLMRDVAPAYHRWEFRVEDDEGRQHSLVEALEHRSQDSRVDLLYALRLPPVMVKIAPPLRAVKLTLD